MQQKSNGQNYAPVGKADPVCRKGEFPVGVIGLDHGHIFGMCNGLLEAGADIAVVYDTDPEKVKNFRERFPSARVAGTESEILDSPDIKMVASASIPSERAPLGLRVMDKGKDFFSNVVIPRGISPGLAFIGQTLFVVTFLVSHQVG